MPSFISTPFRSIFSEPLFFLEMRRPISVIPFQETTGQNSGANGGIQKESFIFFGEFFMLGNIIILCWHRMFLDKPKQPPYTSAS